MDNTEEPWQEELLALLGTEYCHRLCLCFALCNLMIEVPRKKWSKILHIIRKNFEQAPKNKRVIRHVEHKKEEIWGQFDAIRSHISDAGLFIDDDPETSWQMLFTRDDLTSRALVMDAFLESGGVINLTYMKDGKICYFRDYIKQFE